MEKKVFEVREFTLIGGKTLYTYLEREDLVFDEQRQVFKDKEGFVQQRNSYFFLTTDLSRFNKEDLFPYGTELLPYKAKLTQDLPSSMSKYLDPTEYPNCQLMGEKRGGYLQFKDLDSGEVLIIALNSNNYEPI